MPLFPEILRGPAVRFRAFDWELPGLKLAAYVGGVS